MLISLIYIHTGYIFVVSMEMEILVGVSIAMEILVSSISMSHIEMRILIGGSIEMEILVSSIYFNL